MKFRFTLTGTSPLLMHADDVDKQDELKLWQIDPANKAVSTKGDDRSPPWTWQTYLYAANGVLVVPSDNLSACLREAGSTMPTGKGMKTFKEASQVGIYLHEDSFPLLVNGKTIPIDPIKSVFNDQFTSHLAMAESLGFSLFKKRAKVGSGKHVRVRPRFDSWSISGTVEIVAKEVTESVLFDMFKIAGFYKGIGDWRPSSGKPGRFGRFATELQRI